jgi:hypothetical protein
MISEVASSQACLNQRRRKINYTLIEHCVIFVNIALLLVKITLPIRLLVVNIVD